MLYRKECYFELCFKSPLEKLVIELIQSQAKPQYLIYDGRKSVAPAKILREIAFLEFLNYIRYTGISLARYISKPELYITLIRVLVIVMLSVLILLPSQR